MLLAEPKIRRWTKSEYHQAAELGWFDEQRVEFINGEVVAMPPQKDAHAFTVRLVEHALRGVFGTNYTLLVQMPMNLGPSSEPEPDVAVVRGALREVKKHPKTAVLIVEVSDTTLSFDRGIKSQLYASNGIRDYWIVNLIDRQLEIYRNPIADAKATLGYIYAERMVLRPSDSVSPLGARKAKIKVISLLP